MPRNFPKDAKASDDQTFTCDDCRGTFKAWHMWDLPSYGGKVVGGGGAAEFAEWRDTGATTCKDCTCKRERKEMAERHPRGEPYSVYLSKDGKTVGTWHGMPLGTVVVSHATNRDPGTWGRRGDVRHVRVRDLDGKHWHGYGIPSMHMNLRPYKTRPS